MAITIYSEDYYEFEKPGYIDNVNKDKEWWDLAYDNRYDSFEDILDKFPDGILRDLCNSVELDALAMAMKETDQEIVDRVVGNLPQKKQAM